MIGVIALWVDGTHLPACNFVLFCIYKQYNKYKYSGGNSEYIIQNKIHIFRIFIKNLILFGLILWLGFTFLPAEQKARFSTMGSDSTSESRLLYWEKGLDMLDQHKLLGIGYAAFPDYFKAYYASDVTFENFAYRREVAHNTLIQVAS